MTTRFSKWIDADALRAAIAAQCDRADHAIDADAMRRAAATAAGAGAEADLACPAEPGLRYVVAPGAAPRRLPPAAFRQPLRLRLDALEVTLYGHCAYRTFGWERRREAVLSLRRAPWWRRLLGAAPLMALTFDARGGAPAVGPAPAARRRPRRPADTVIRLDPAGQAALADAHAAHLRGRFAGTRLLGAILRSWRRDAFIDRAA